MTMLNITATDLLDYTPPDRPKIIGGQEFEVHQIHLRDPLVRFRVVVEFVANAPQGEGQSAVDENVFLGWRNPAILREMRNRLEDADWPVWLCDKDLRVFFWGNDGLAYVAYFLPKYLRARPLASPYYWEYHRPDRPLPYTPGRTERYYWAPGPGNPMTRVWDVLQKYKPAHAVTPEQLDLEMAASGQPSQVVPSTTQAVPSTSQVSSRDVLPPVATNYRSDPRGKGKGPARSPAGGPCSSSWWPPAGSGMQQSGAGGLRLRVCTRACVHWCKRELDKSPGPLQACTMAEQGHKAELGRLLVGPPVPDAGSLLALVFSSLGQVG